MADPTPVDELRRASEHVVRRGLQVGLVVFVLVVGYFAVTLWQVWTTGRSDQARPVDAIVVMGAAQYDGRPSPQLAARLDHVVELWPDGLAPMVVVTGGKQPADRFTEAEASAQYLIDRGIPASAIVLENDGSNSYDSLERVAAILGDRAADGDGGQAGQDARDGQDAPSVLVVTDPYHSLRSRLIAQEVGLRAYVSPTDTSVVTGARSLERHVWEAGGVAIGRITGFDWLSNVTD